MSDAKLSLGQALRIVAERTSFQTEEQGAAVLAAIDELVAEEGDEVVSAEELVDDAPVDERDARIAELERQLAERDQAKEADKTPDASPASFDLNREPTPAKSAPAKKTTAAALRGRSRNGAGK